MATALRIGYGWKALSKAIKLIFCPAALSSFFAALSILSSRIATNGHSLLKGGECGNQVTDNVSSLDSVIVRLIQNSENGMSMALSNSFAKECYTNPLVLEPITLASTDPSRSSCDAYALPSLNYSVSNRNVCPFGDACAATADQILQLDTGYLDSHYDLGLNQPKENRVLFRRVSTCSPLKTSGFSDDSFHYVERHGGLGNISLYTYGNGQYQITRNGITLVGPEPDATFMYSANAFTDPQSAYSLM